MNSTSNKKYNEQTTKSAGTNYNNQNSDSIDKYLSKPKYQSQEPEISYFKPDEIVPKNLPKSKPGLFSKIQNLFFSNKTKTQGNTEHKAIFDQNTLNQVNEKLPSQVLTKEYQKNLQELMEQTNSVSSVLDQNSLVTIPLTDIEDSY